MSDENKIETNNSRVLAGLFIIAIGLLFFVKQAGFVVFPYWVFSWPMILIAVGVYSGVKHNFRGSGWLILVIVGAFFLFDDILDMYDLSNYLVPAILVAVGVMVILRPRKKDCWRGRKNRWTNSFDTAPQQSFSSEASAAAVGTETPKAGTGDSYEDIAGEVLDATAIFGSIKKNILSKNFRGGDATSIFGGSEIDLSKADINGTVMIDVTALLGGVKLVVPSHWVVKQEIAAIFGGVEDKRDMHSVITVQNKVLLLKGTAFMGGIEIASYR